MSYVESVVLGVVQGVSEFLPISSTAHLRVVPALLGWDDPGAAYSAIIQLGTTLAILIYFARDIGGVTRGFFGALLRRRPLETLEARLGWCVVIGTLPVVVLGVLLRHFIEHQFRSLYVIAYAAIGLALLLTAAELAARHARKIEEVTLVDGLVVGLAQAVALIPGSSRSGTTLTAGLFMGLTRDAAARFSFLLSIPATLAAGLFELRHLADEGAASDVGPLVAGALVSLVVGYLSIAWLLRFLRTRSTAVFIVYRVLLGVALLVALGRGALG